MVRILSLRTLTGVRRNIAARSADITRSRVLRAVYAFAAGLLLLVVPIAAHAQSASPSPGATFDYAGLATTAQGQVNTALGAFMPVVIGIFVTLLGIGMIWRWVRRGAKTS